MLNSFSFIFCLMRIFFVIRCDIKRERCMNGKDFTFPVPYTCKKNCTEEIVLNKTTTNYSHVIRRERCMNGKDFTFPVPYTCKKNCTEEIVLNKTSTNYSHV